MAETLATYTVPEHHVLMFTSNVQASLARFPGVLEGTVSMGSYIGEKVQAVNFLGPVSFTKRTTRYQDTEFVETKHTQRWLQGDEYDCAIPVDRLDTLKMLYEPTSPYVERMREAAGRTKDEIIMDAFYADALTGKKGESSVAFPSADTILHGGTGLTVDKLRATRKLFKKRYVDLRIERPHIAVSAEEADDLLGDEKMINADYAAVKPLVNGEIVDFMGFTFVPVEDIIPTRSDSGTVRQCPAWVQSGMHMGSWDDLSILVSDRPDKRHMKQIFGTFTCGATRLEEGKVLMVEAKE